MEEKVLSLDVSTKTGWAFMLSYSDRFELIDSGQIPAITEPPGLYPGNFVHWAYLNFVELVQLIERFAPDSLVIEETVAGSKAVYSQKILEYTHFLLARLIKETGIKARYFLTGEWRTIVGCLMTKEEKERNKAVRNYKKKTGAKLARDKNNKIIGKIGKKHVNVRRANELFGKFLERPLQKKDEDRADALLLLGAYQMEKQGKNDRKA